MVVLAQRSGLAGSCLVAILAACNSITGSDRFATDGDDITLPSRETGGTSGSIQTPIDGEASHGRGTSRGGDASTGDPDAAATVDASTGVPDFIDVFDRADGPSLGNGWLEKQDRFSLAGGAVVQGGKGSYIDFFVRRPVSEAALDVELSVDFVYGQNIEVDPSLYARVQPSSDQTGVLQGYVFYAFRDGAGIDREDGRDFAELVGGAIQPNLVPGQTYHYVFRVRGTDPVMLEAAITKDGAVVKSFSTTDGDARRVSSAGQIGFGAGYSDGGRWDNFRLSRL